MVVLYKGVKGYHRPKSVEEAIELLQKLENARVIGGNTRLPLTPEKGKVEHLVDLQDVGLSGVRKEGDVLLIGATTQIGDLMEEELPPLLARALSYTPEGWKWPATVGGVLASGLPYETLPIALMAMGAKVEVAGPEGSREVSIEDLYTGKGVMKLGSREIITWIKVPTEERPWAFEAVAVVARLFPQVSIALTADLDGGRISNARVGLAGVAKTPIRCETLEKALEGLDPASEVPDGVLAFAESLEPPYDPVASSEYRKYAIKVLARRAIMSLRRWLK